MRVLIVYATTEGQTRKIARFAADHLGAAGHSVELLHAADGDDLDSARFDGAILAGSVHAGSFQEELSGFARDHAGKLGDLRTLFVAVSLSAAGSHPEDWAGLEAAVTRFCAQTGWTPGQVAHVAGALRFSEYSFFRYWAMRWIAQHRDESVQGGADVEYTDWDALRAVLDAWVVAG